MTSLANGERESPSRRAPRRLALLVAAAVACAVVPQPPLPALAAETESDANGQEHETMPAAGPNGPSMQMSSMDMGSMQGGGAPSDARDPDAYAEGYSYTGMAGWERSDQITLGRVLADELELLSGDDGQGAAWRVQGSYGGDLDKLWLRTQGLVAGGKTDPTTDLELLWWRPYAPFWGALLGGRQDFGPGAHTYLAFGVQGLSPYWFEVEATGYVGEDGRLSARFKGSYELLFTNRLILTPELESNIYSRPEPDRGLGAGLGNVEAGLRLRYEVRREFAPYAGYVWERSFGKTADRRIAAGDPVTEHRFVVGARVWW